MSLHDWAACEDAATDDNWAVPQGDGTLIARHAQGVPVQLDTLVSRIDHRGAALRVETSRGTIETRAAIVCVPTTMLAEERGIVFDPPLPEKHEAATALPLGLADKVYLYVDGIELPNNGHLIGDPHSNCTASYRLGPLGLPLIECFFGGDCAEALEPEGDGAAADFAIRELVALLGSDWRSRMTPVVTTRWRAEAAYPRLGLFARPYRCRAATRGAGRARRRPPVLCRRRPVHGTDFSTAHGAYETGIAAARAVIGTVPAASRFTTPASLA